MSQKNTVTEQLLASCGLHLEDVLEYIDELHSAASERKSQSFTGMNEAETLSYLRDLIYTAQEAIQEIETSRAQRRNIRNVQPVLRIVEKIDKAG